MADATGIELLRNSERATWRRCRQKWEWNYRLRLAPERVKGALTFGTMVHKALEVYYPPGRKRGPHPAGEFKKLYLARPGVFDQWDEEGNKVAAMELGIAMLEGYVDLYGADDTIEVVQPEMSVQVDVYDRQGNYLCTWVGQTDLVYYDLSKSTKQRKVLKILDHKTAKSIEDMTSVISGYGEQGLSYYWAAELHFHQNGMLAEDEHISGVTFNWLRKGLPDDRPRNAQGHALNQPKKDVLSDECARLGAILPKRPTMDDMKAALRGLNVNPDLLGEPAKRQPRPLFHRDHVPFGPTELDSINKRIRAEAWEISQVKQNKLPIYKNPTKDCNWDCPFKDACEIHEMGGDWESVLDLEFNKWDPYDAHELEEEKAHG